MSAIAPFYLFCHKVFVRLQDEFLSGYDHLGQLLNRSFLLFGLAACVLLLLVGRTLYVHIWIMKQVGRRWLSLPPSSVCFHFKSWYTMTSRYEHNTQDIAESKPKLVVLTAWLVTNHCMACDQWMTLLNAQVVTNEQRHLHFVRDRVSWQLNSCTSNLCWACN